MKKNPFHCILLAAVLVSAIFGLHACRPTSDAAEVAVWTARFDSLEAANDLLARQLAASEQTVEDSLDSYYAVMGASESLRGKFEFAHSVLVIASDRQALLDSIRFILDNLQAYGQYDAGQKKWLAPGASMEVDKFWHDRRSNFLGEIANRAVGLRLDFRDFVKALDYSMERAVAVEWHFKAEDPLVDEPGRKWEDRCFNGTGSLESAVHVLELANATLELNRKFLDDALQYLGISKEAKGPAAKPGKLALRCEAVSDTVPAGMKFEAKISITNLPDHIMPEFSGGGVTVDPGGRTATLTATTPGGFAKGVTNKKGEQTVTAKVPLATGGVEKFSTTCRYIIRQPRVTINPQPGATILKNRPTRFTFQCPDFGDYFSPQVTATDAKVEKSTKTKHAFDITPTGSSLEIRVSSLTNGQNILLAKETYELK